MKSELVCYPFRWIASSITPTPFRLSVLLSRLTVLNHSRRCFTQRAQECWKKTILKVKNYYVLITLIKREQWRDINDTKELLTSSANFAIKAFDANYVHYHILTVVFVVVFMACKSFFYCAKLHLKYWLWLIVEQWKITKMCAITGNVLHHYLVTNCSRFSIFHHFLGFDQTDEWESLQLVDVVEA